MNILITGGAGYIGSHVAWALVDRGVGVVVLDDLSTGVRALVPPAAEFVMGDARDGALVAAVLKSFKIEAILHFAARTVVPESVADPLGYYDANTVSTVSLVRAAIEQGVQRFVFSSTAAVYGDGGGGPVKEHGATNPISPYGRSKLISEWVLRDAAAAHGLQYAVLRYFNVAGADPAGRTGQATPRATHLIKVAAEVAVGKRPFLEIFGDDYPTRDGTCVRDYIHVSDLADAHLAALSHLEAGGDSLTLNCGYGSGFTVREVLAAVERAAGKSVPIRLAARRPGDAAEVVADAQALHERLGWRPLFNNIDEIARTAVAWENARGSAQQ